jgi:hypothetical protein
MVVALVRGGLRVNLEATVRDQSEQLGALRAELDALRALQEPQNGALDAPGATEGRIPHSELLRLCGPLALGIVLALVGSLVVLMAWPR